MLTQSDLAQRCDLTPSAVSRFESGARDLSWAVLTRLLAALDLQPVLSVEALDAHLWRKVDAERAKPEGSWLEDLWFDGLVLVRLLTTQPLVADGTLAARLLGVPVPVGDVDLLLVDAPGAVGRLADHLGTRFLRLREADEGQADGNEAEADEGQGDADAPEAPAATEWCFDLTERLVRVRLLDPAAGTLDVPLPQSEPPTTVRVLPLGRVRIVGSDARLFDHAVRTVAHRA